MLYFRAFRTNEVLTYVLYLLNIHGYLLLQIFIFMTPMILRLLLLSIHKNMYMVHYSILNQLHAWKYMPQIYSHI